MKFSLMIEKGQQILRGAVRGAAALAETGILDNLPIVSNILAGAQLINDTLEGKEEADDSLADVKATVELVSPIVVKLSSAKDKLGDETLNNNLKAINEVLEGLWDNIEAYVKKNVFIKFTTAEQSTSQFSEDLETLRKALDTLSFTLTGETFVSVLRTEAKVDKIMAFEAKKTVQERRQSR